MLERWFRLAERGTTLRTERCRTSPSCNRRHRLRRGRSGDLSGIDASDVTESLPAFLVLVGIPLTYSIPDGLALGFVAQPVLKTLAGRSREVRPAGAALAFLLLCWFAFLRGS